jgi:hypothetical protein
LLAETRRALDCVQSSLMLRLSAGADAQRSAFTTGELVAGFMVWGIWLAFFLLTIGCFTKLELQKDKPSKPLRGRRWMADCNNKRRVHD